MRILLSLLALPLGCSVINSFEDVSGISGDGSGGDNQGGAGGSVHSGGDAGAESGGSDSGGSSSGGSGGSDSGGTSSGGTGGSVEVDPGLLVMQAEDKDQDALVLSVLSPQTGKELARENGSFPGIAYDSTRDIWFLLRSDDGFANPGPTAKITLEARKFDRASNEWEILTETPITVPLPLDGKQLYAVNERVVLLAFKDVSINSAQAVVYDTSKPNDLKVMGSLDLGSHAERPILGAVASPLPVGGSVNVLRRNCGAAVGGGCNIELERIAALEDATLGTPDVVGLVPGSGDLVAGTYNWAAEKIVLAFPALENATIPSGYIQQFNTLTHKPDTNQFPFPALSSPQLRVAVDACVGVGYVTAALDVKAVAVPFIANGIPVDVDLGHNGKSLVIEPQTRTLLAPFDSASDFKITAFQIQGDQASPTFTQRVGSWVPPSKLSPLVIVSALPERASDVCQ